MSYYNTDLCQLKREIVNFSNLMSMGCKKVERNMILDIIYGIESSKNVLISNIARELKEDIKLDNTVERICIRLNKFDNNIVLRNNYYSYLRTYLPTQEEDRKAVFDDSDIAKICGKKFENLDMVRDASDPKERIVPGYHVCNATVQGLNEKQPFWVYSKIYSTKSKEFKSMNDETHKSIEAVYELYEHQRFTGIFDSGYDDKKLFRYLNKKGIDFIIRMDGSRNMLFKGKSKNVMEVANGRKGKICMNVMREDGNHQNLLISYTRANLTDGKKEEFTLIFVYGLGKEPMILITNKIIKDKYDVIKIARSYIERWKIEEVHRVIKDEYNYEDMRMRTLKSLNNFNQIFMMMTGFITSKIETMDSNLLSIKIIVRSSSYRTRCVVWLSQFARGIKEILRYAQVGIKEFKRRRKVESTKQLAFKF